MFWLPTTSSLCQWNILVFTMCRLRERKHRCPLLAWGQIYNPNQPIKNGVWGKSLFQKREGLIDGGLVMKRRHQRAWRGGEEGSVETTQKKSEGGGVRRIAFLLCSIKGEITHLLRFFLKTTAPIDQTAWMYRPIFNMKYRHQKSITPVFSLPLLLSADLTCSFPPRLMHLHHCRLSSRPPSPHLCSFPAMDLPTASPWHLHYVIRRYTCLTNGEVDHIQ